MGFNAPQHPSVALLWLPVVIVVVLAASVLFLVF